VVRANQLAEPPNESWRNLQLAIHVELGQVPEAIDLLKENIGIWPDRLRFYQVLSACTWKPTTMKAHSPHCSFPGIAECWMPNRTY